MKRVLLLFLLSVVAGMANCQQKATLKIDASKKYQYVTGFGAFVCSPQFQYNHMSNSDIKKVWGTTSTVGCNIMRLYIPIGKNSWSQSLATAKAAKEMGLIVFASPWGQPVEWKTNGTINAKDADGTLGYLKKENWADYAQYLEDYVQYLRNNGVELDAISIQNEPDWPAQYAGCLWSASDIAEFVKTYGRTISCKIMAPETLAVSDSYANALNNTETLNSFDIYGGHQYGGIQSAYKNLGKKGKQLWMTEYLINWNESEGTDRSFDFSKDFFNFFRAINVCMLGDFNAWIHYAAKRYYGLLGDGTKGAGSTGVGTKRGYVMAHFAKYVTGMTRVAGTFSDDASTALEGSAYLSVTGDTVVAVIANPSADDRTLLLDLPFYTMKGVSKTTNKTRNLLSKSFTFETETCRPEVPIAAQSVCTVLFVRSRDRQPSDMKGSMIRFDRIEDQTATKTTYGTAYKLSNKTKTFDHSNPLFSAKTDAASGYLKLSKRFDKLVIQVKSISSTLSLSSAKTTLIYVNGKGTVSTHNYGDLDLNRGSNFNLVFDLSPATLTDGCLGIISMTNDNWSSKLSLTLGDVYLSNGGNYSATLSGAYVEDDSYVYDYSTDPACTSVNMSSVTNMPSVLPWLNNNKVVFAAETTPIADSQQNIVKGTACSLLTLDDENGNFRPVKSFTADKAELSIDIIGMRLLQLPFNANLPEGVKAYNVKSDYSLEAVDYVQAGKTVLVTGNGEYKFVGSGNVITEASQNETLFCGTFVEIPLYAGDYVMRYVDGKWGFEKLTSNAILSPFDAYAKLNSSDAFIELNTVIAGIRNINNVERQKDKVAFNMLGQRVDPSKRGLLILRGKRIFKR